MTKGRTVATAMIGATALLLSLMPAAHAAQCGNGPGGFEAWKREFGAEAQGKGIGQTAIPALMQTNYASATIGADRSQHSFGLSLDQFLAKRGASTIVARGRSLKVSQGALFASIEQRYGVPPGPLIAIWGMETGFGSQRGNQNMLSSIATLAYDCRRPEFFTVGPSSSACGVEAGRSRYAVGVHPRLHAWRGRPDPVHAPRTSWPTAPATLEVAANALSSTANFPESQWLACGSRLPAGRAEFRRHPGLECGRRLPEGHRADGPADRRGWRGSGGALRRSARRDLFVRESCCFQEPTA